MSHQTSYTKATTSNRVMNDDKQKNSNKLNNSTNATQILDMLGAGF